MWLSIRIVFHFNESMDKTIIPRRGFIFFYVVCHLEEPSTIFIKRNEQSS